MHQNGDRELDMSRFGEYMLKSRVLPEKYAPYYVKWVRKFMIYVPDKPSFNFENRLYFSHYLFVKVEN